jgi:dienelactone hydrolase
MRLLLDMTVPAMAIAVAAANSLAADDQPTTVSVARTFDGKPFEYRMRPLVKRGGFTVYRLTYPSPVTTGFEPNNTIPADYYLPDGVRPDGPKRPAVICMHILEGNFELVEMTCSVLASRGIPAIMFKLPYYGERGTAEGPRKLAADPALFAEAITQAMADVRRTVDVLASRPEVDPQHIGITGISLGGIVAATASAMEPRLGRAFLMIAGGDLLTIIYHARETELLSQMLRAMPAGRRAEIEAKIRTVDPLELAGRLKERARAGRVRMVNAAEDEVIPRACTEKLAAALGIQDRVVWFEGLGHYTAMAELPRALLMMADFFAEDLPEELKTAPPPIRQQTPLELLVSLASQAAALATSDPPEGRCRLADIEVSVTPGGARPIDARLLVVRGAGHKFKIQLDASGIAEIGRIGLGQGRFPWLAAGGKVVFEGTENAGPLRDPLELADPDQATRVRVLAGAAAAVAMAPDLLLRWIRVEDDVAAGQKTIRITAKDETPGRVELVFRQDGKTPNVARFEVDGAKGTVRFHGWQECTVAPAALFEPPAEVPRKAVDQGDVYRIIAGVFNFAMERTQ